MENEQLSEVVDLLESSSAVEESYFAIFADLHHESSYVRANKQGLERMAAKLLLAASRSQDIIENKESFINLGLQEEWDDGDIFLDYVEVIDKKENVFYNVEHEETFQDQLIKVGCLAIIVFLFVSMIVGVGSIIGWLF